MDPLATSTLKSRPARRFGIIGINGAGKSTLLKLDYPELKAYDDRRHRNLRACGAAFELGMDSTDFTGRQNVYMSGGQLLGLSSDKITELMPEIEEVCGNYDYIDQPVRVYSSGMQVRHSAFSVAAAIRPDVLIIPMRRSPLAMLISSIKVFGAYSQIPP